MNHFEWGLEFLRMCFWIHLIGFKSSFLFFKVTFNYLSFTKRVVICCAHPLRMYKSSLALAIIYTWRCKNMLDYVWLRHGEHGMGGPMWPVIGSLSLTWLCWAVSIASNIREKKFAWSIPLCNLGTLANVTWFTPPDIWHGVQWFLKFFYTAY